MFRSLGSAVRAYGVDADVYDAAIDIVRDIGTIRILGVHQMSTGDLLCDLEADVTADVELDLHPAEATMLDTENRASVRDFGYGTSNASAIAQLAMRAVVEATIDPGMTSVKALSVTALEPAI